MNSLHPLAFEDFKRDDETESLLQLSLGIQKQIWEIQEDVSRAWQTPYEDYDDSEFYPDPWTPICRREDECCKKTKKEACYFCK